MQAPSENTDVKLDTSNEPSAHLIEENVALPEEIFHSYFSYLLYEMAHCKPVMITFLLNTCLVLLFLFFHDSPSTILFYIYSLLIFVPMLGAFIKRSRAPIQNQDFEAELLVEVIKRKPAVRGKEWRTITYNMNQYLLGHGLWNTPYYFYGDEQCYVYFLSLIAGVTPKKQTTASIDDIADAQSNVPTTVTPGEDIEPASPSSAPNYRNFLLKAAEIEQQAQNNYWKERYKLGMHISLESTDTKLDTSNEPSAQLIEENVALPKDIFRSYLSYWIYEGAHSKPIMIMFLASVILISLTNFRVYHLIPLLPSILCSSPQQINNKGFNTNLSSEVSTCKPSVKEEWRIITYKMNEYLFDHEIWSTPYYFYCEEDCHRYFLNFIEGRTFEKPTSNAEENVQETEAGESFTLNPGPDFQNCFSKTADIVEQSQVNIE
ncbi:CDG_1a_G0019600.mRNA.1.CDS.1 [Saccharomyces cerevisiae]|nr:CDG_1a_G0019600.mRNA.1.CDS.1 [Saccharomyces cerevisiae]CAI7296171.1 CDG_1a_G0019600.mRNA.1.CDS.1 [Saccharomyces cerevisiae]